MGIKHKEEVTLEQWEKVNPKNKKIVEEFLQESIQLSDQTLSQYKSALQIYFVYICEFCDNKDFDTITSRDFLLFQNSLTRRGLSSSAVRLKRAAVSSLNTYIETFLQLEKFRNYITKKIAAPVHQFVNEKNPPTLEEYKKICDELEKREEWQMLAYLKFTFSTGCRRGESVQLKKEVINYPIQEKIVKTKDEYGKLIEKKANFYLSNKIRCKGSGKIGKIRVFQFDEDAMLSIKKWLDIRGNDDCEYVFISGKGKKAKKINPATLNLWGSTIFTEILGRRFHPHILRESRATTLNIEQGKDIKSIQKLLGHNSSETTSIYIISNNDDMSDDIFT